MRYAWIALVVLIVSCSRREPAPLPAVTDYFPLQTRHYSIFLVDSTVITQNVSTTYHYQLQTVLTDSFPNSEGGYTYVMQRSKRSDSTSAWTSMESWSLRATPYEAVVNEGNVAYLKIVGPPGNGVAWNGNAYNVNGGTEKCPDADTFTCDIYEITGFMKAFTAGNGLSFQNTMTVDQNDDEDLTQKDVRSEVYAKGVGLVSRQMNVLEYCTVNCTEDQFVDTGLIYTQTIIAYGGQ